MEILYNGDTYHISDCDVYCNRDTYQFGWEFMRDGDLPTTNLHHHVYDCANAEIASAIVKAVAERFANDEEFRNSIINNVRTNSYDEEISLSIQTKDDEEKPLMEATSKTTEDTHGGDEATKSIENSPSAANEGKEDNENSSEAAGENSKDEMFSDAAQSGSMTHSASDILAAIENEPFDDHGAVQSAFDHVVRCVQGKAEGSRLNGWDGRKITKHLLTRQLNRIPTDRKRTGACREVVVAIDCSGSCWIYLNTIKKALQKLSKTHKVVIVDVSNGWSSVDVTKGGDDPYENRKRLEEAFCDARSITMHPTITTPSIETAAKLAEQAEAMIIVADYDGYLSIAKSVQLIGNHQKYPWFIDLEERYDDPSEHSWNYDADATDRYWSEEDWPVAARNRWLKLFPRGEEY